MKKENKLANLDLHIFGFISSHGRQSIRDLVKRFEVERQPIQQALSRLLKLKKIERIVRQEHDVIKSRFWRGGTVSCKRNRAYYSLPRNDS